MPEHAPRVPFVLLLLGLLVGGLAVLLVLNTASAANELRRHDLAARDYDVAARVEHLRNEIARSQAPGNLAQVAAGLGMVPAGNPAFVQIGADGQVTVLGSPAPVSAPPAPPASRTPASHPSPTKPADPTKTKNEKTKTKTETKTQTKTKNENKSSGETASGRRAGTATATTTPTHPTPTPTTTLPGGAR